MMKFLTGWMASVWIDAYIFELSVDDIITMGGLKISDY